MSALLSPPQDTTNYDLERSILSIVSETYRDLHGGESREVTLDDTLDRDLGFDSLARVELLTRVARVYDIQLSEHTLAEVQTPRDLIAALHEQHRIAPRQSIERRPAPSERPIISAPQDATTLLEVLQWHVARHPHHRQILVLSENGEHGIDYQELHDHACEVATGLLALGLSKGQTVALMLPTSPDYFYAYYGVLYAGGVPVPLYPPARPNQIEEHVRRHALILENARASILVTVPEAMSVAKLLRTSSPYVSTVTTVAALAQKVSAFESPAMRSDDVALIQYTSGSTGNPKGVVLQHAQLLANIRAMGQAVAVTPQDVFVSWLPLYHDMGLISAWLATQYFGCSLVVMPPLAFLAQPVQWLRAIHRHRGTVTAAPNFAYELCITKSKDDELEGLDLSSLRFAANGSESVSMDTIARFVRRFEPFGLRPTAMAPVYGLAESTVALLCPPLDRGMVVDRIERDTFVRGHFAVRASDEAVNALRFVGCGRPLPGHDIRIVDETGAAVPERVEGELEFRGPSATRGYFHNPEATRTLLHDGWLRTGDRAYVAGHDVYITGRVKDIIIRGGRNIYPHEIEEAVGALPGVRKGCVAAFGSHDRARGTERLVVLAESTQIDRAVQTQLRNEISRVIVDLLGEPPDDVVLAPPQTVLKTSSGKIRRAATKAVYESGLVGAPRHAVWWQFTRLTISAWHLRLTRSIGHTARLLYGVYARLVWSLIATLAWLITAALRSPERAWSVNHRIAQVFFKLAAIRITAHGLDRLPRDGAYILVANHSSYLDGLVLLATLPRSVSFVAKRELEDNLISGLFLRRLGALFVERFAVEQSVKDAERLLNAARAGTSLGFFPEGTFRRESGLLPFHLGAFSVAAKAHLPVIPVAITGTRDVLPNDDWLFRPGAITLTVLEAVLPPANTADDLSVAIALRDNVRARIVSACDERSSDT